MYDFTHLSPQYSQSIETESKIVTKKYSLLMLPHPRVRGSECFVGAVSVLQDEKEFCRRMIVMAAQQCEST